MSLKQFYFNLSIRYKILLFFYIIVIFIALVLGFYSYAVSENNVMQNVSSAYLGILRQVGNNIEVLKNDMTDISTYLCLDQAVQDFLTMRNTDEVQDIYPTRNDSLKFIMNLIVSKSYISVISIYGDNGLKPYYIITDRSSGLNEDFASIKKTEMYRIAEELKGAPFWFSLDNDNDLLLNNSYPKIAMCRIIRDQNTSENIGLLVMCLNKNWIENFCLSNIQNGKQGMAIVDNTGKIIIKVGADFYSEINKEQAFVNASTTKQQGTLTDSIKNKKYLISYSMLNDLGWKIYYAVPMESLTEQINSIKTYIIIVVLACVLLSFPLMLLISSLLTAPIRKLLKSMKSFQVGNFDERVEFKYKDEIGELGTGYNNMVKNIKELIDKAYVLQIKEREAELDALQAQINPHFLYNTLDTIFWKCQARGEKDISEMVYSLSRLFRLSLNRGKGLTSISKEKELIEHYLLLQKIRFKEKLNYEIQIDDEILKYIVPKLIIQPFIENAILHGLEGRENGGTIKISGRQIDEKIQFVIEDDGIGMDQKTIDSLFSEDDENSIVSSNTQGGYAVKNVYDRLKLNYGDKFSLKFTSEIGKGTRVEILIPASNSEESGEDRKWSN